MLVLLIQIIGTIATAIIAIILLQKDWRTKNEATRKEAVLVTKIIYAVSAVSILNMAISYFQSQSDINKLEKDKRQLQVINANLSLNVSKTADASSGHEVPYKKALNKPEMPMNEEIQNFPTTDNKAEPKKQTDVSKKSNKHSAQVNNVRKIAVTGTRNMQDKADELPLFHFVSTGGRVLSGVLISKANKPVYNLSMRITNYDDLMECKCLIGNTNSTTIGALNTQSTYFFKLPKFKRRAQNGRYLLTLRFNNKLYDEEAVYAFAGHRHFTQALRVKQYKDSMLVSTTIIRLPGYKLRYVNWDRGFPLSLHEQSRKGYIASN